MLKIGTYQSPSDDRPSRVFGTAKLEQIRKGAKGARGLQGGGSAPFMIGTGRPEGLGVQPPIIVFDGGHGAQQLVSHRKLNSGFAMAFYRRNGSNFVLG